MRVGIILCARYRDCGGGKCFRALRERTGGFARYPAGEPLEVVGYTTCGGCPGGNVEAAPVEFLKHGCDVVHLATGMVVGYPPCPNLERFRTFIESVHGLPVVVGTHPIPQKYWEAHQNLPFWQEAGMAASAAELLSEPIHIRKAYDA